MSELRVYLPHECGADGYPFVWHETVKHLIREQAGNRCERCGHPYAKGDGEWSPCDERCTHVAPKSGPVRIRDLGGELPTAIVGVDGASYQAGVVRASFFKETTAVEARWRILTVHHLLVGDEHKRDLRWWNLASLCQRCHLLIQRKVVMDTPWPWPHTGWFRPHAAGWYAVKYLGEDLTREETEARMDELLALEHAGDPLFEVAE